MEYPCCFCQEPIGGEDLLMALVWCDPSGESVIAHYLCTAMFDGLPAWPRERKAR